MKNKTLLKEIPGICVLLGALKRAWNAYLAYIKAIKAARAFKKKTVLLKRYEAWGRR